MGNRGVQWGSVDRCYWANTSTPWTRRTASPCRRAFAWRWQTASFSPAGSTPASRPTRPGDWTQLVEDRLAGLDPLSHETRVLERFYYTGAIEAKPDKQGRVMLPPVLIEHATLGREVVVVGMRGRIEIWDRAAWRAQIEEVMGSAEHVAERLAARHD